MSDVTGTPGKVALVTGGSRGLGREVAISLARRGVHSVVTYRSNRDEAERALEDVDRAGARAAILQLDLADKSSLDGFAGALHDVLRATFDRDTIDFLVNNAGTGVSGKPVGEVGEDDLDSLVGVDLRGTFLLTRNLLPMIVDGGGIVTVTSSLTHFALPGASAYAMMKGALEVFTRYLAKELAPRRITANAVAPGPIETDFGDGWIRDPEFVKTIVPTIALRRVGVTEDVGPLVASVLSEEFRFVTGQRIEVSGGQNL